MIGSNLFSIPMWTLPVLNFSKKKKQLEQLVKAFPEKKHGLQTFYTNRQIERPGFDQAFYNILEDEFKMLSQKMKLSMQIEDIWSVTYKRGDYHTPHDHGSTGLAGILYLNMPKDASPTQYIQPWNHFVSDRTIYKPVGPVEGTIVITPKFVKHFTEPHKSKKIKRIISWDMKVF
tara:strand:- start:51 stop:575 length:525 start_codon:yes stop_codon:yes gene_type:complete